MRPCNIAARYSLNLFSLLSYRFSFCLLIVRVSVKCDCMRQFVAQMISRRLMPANLECPHESQRSLFNRGRIAVGEDERGASP